MRKIKILCAVLLLATVVFLTSCSYGLVDFTQKFNYAYVYCGNDLIAEGIVEQWFGGENVVQVQIAGKVYMTHIMNVILVEG